MADNKVNELLKFMQNNNLTLAIAESVTCGMASSMLASYKGTSDVLKGSIVCYSPDVKTSLLRISGAAIKKYSPESAEVTSMLAKKLSHLIIADVSAAITGLASEGASESKNKPVGTIFISVLYKDSVHMERKLFRGTPLQIRKKASVALFECIAKIIIT